MRIDVTQENIDLGKKFCPLSCPIARAFQDNNIIAVVGGHTISFNGCSVHIPLSPKMLNFMYKFDGDEKVKPFSFKFDGESFVDINTTSERIRILAEKIYGYFKRAW